MLPGPEFQPTTVLRVNRNIMALTDKQRKFVAEYLVDMNATRAAEAVGYHPKMAAKLVAKSSIAAAIAEAMDNRIAETKVDANYVLKRLHDENEADLADLYDPETGVLLPVHKWPLIWRKGLIQGVDVEELRDEGEIIGVVRKVKISDRIRRTELIGKHVDVQAFSDRVDVTVTDRAGHLARARQRKAADASRS